MIIKRYFSDVNFERLKRDFGFLMKTIRQSNGELDLSLRNTYFNLYYKGNSLAKVVFKPSGNYEVTVHEKFLAETGIAKDKRFKVLKKRDYFQIAAQQNNLRALFQTKYLKKLCANIKRVHYGEEIAFEQSLITDNLSREDIIFIDRQVTDTGLKRKRMDLLALSQVKGNQYRFLVVEVKLGNNMELRQKVSKQLAQYISHIEKHFKDYKQCYKQHFVQKRQLGLIDTPKTSIEIIPGVKGLIIVGGYSKIGSAMIRDLKKSYPSLLVKQFDYRLDRRDISR